MVSASGLEFSARRGSNQSDTSALVSSITRDLSQSPSQATQPRDLSPSPSGSSLHTRSETSPPHTPNKKENTVSFLIFQSKYLLKKKIFRIPNKVQRNSLKQELKHHQKIVVILQLKVIFLLEVVVKMKDYHRKLHELIVQLVKQDLKELYHQLLYNNFRLVLK